VWRRVGLHKGPKPQLNSASRPIEISLQFLHRSVLPLRGLLQQRPALKRPERCGLTAKRGDRPIPSNFLLHLLILLVHRSPPIVLVRLIVTLQRDVFQFVSIQRERFRWFSRSWLHPSLGEIKGWKLSAGKALQGENLIALARDTWICLTETPVRVTRFYIFTGRFSSRRSTLRPRAAVGHDQAKRIGKGSWTSR